MNLDHLRIHQSLTSTKMNRREALRLGAVGTFAALGLTALEPSPASTAPLAPGSANLTRQRHRLSPDPFLDDTIFDVAAVEAGAWDDTAFYQRGDQRGTFNEVTPEKTARALTLLQGCRRVVTYNLGELMFNGFPAYRTNPPREYQQRLTVLGYPPPADFAAEQVGGGILQDLTPLGPNKVSVHEERFEATPNPAFNNRCLTMTYQIATQLDNLNHVGVGAVFYGGHRGPDIAAPYGTKKLGNEHMGPIVTRGIVLDIVGLKLRQGATGDLFMADDGWPVLRDNYRITVEDIEEAMSWEGLASIEPGDVVLFRTGWTHLVSTDPARFLAQEPGIYLREARYLAQYRPAIVGSDTWGLEVLDPAVTEGWAFPCHQELLTHYGIRIGESIVTEALVEDGVFEFVYLYAPQYALGATAGNTPPVALVGQPNLAK